MEFGHQLGEDIEENDKNGHVEVVREDEVGHPGGHGEEEKAGEYGNLFVSAESADEIVHEKDTERDDKSAEEFHGPVDGVVCLAEHPHHNLVSLGVRLAILR